MPNDTRTRLKISASRSYGEMNPSLKFLVKIHIEEVRRAALFTLFLLLLYNTVEALSWFAAAFQQCHKDLVKTDGIFNAELNHQIFKHISGKHLIGLIFSTIMIPIY